MVVGGIVEDDQKALAGIRLPDLLEHCCDPLGITRLPAFPADQALVVRGIGPNDVEVIPTGVGLQDH